MSPVRPLKSLQRVHNKSNQHTVKKPNDGARPISTNRKTLINNPDLMNKTG